MTLLAILSSLSSIALNNAGDKLFLLRCRSKPMGTVPESSNVITDVRGALDVLVQLVF